MEGFELLVIGMSTVFVFLAVLVVTVILMSKIARRFETQPFETQPAVRSEIGNDEMSKDTVPAQHIAAIAEAVSRYRAKHGS